MAAESSSAFRIRDFRLITQARFLFSFSTQLQSVVMGWQMYEIKHDPLYLGLIGLAEAVPAITLALISGWVVDRSNPLKIYKAVIRLSFLSAFILFLVSFLPMEGDRRVPWIYAAALITGTARGFSSPALFSLVPQLVPREILKISSAWITSAFQVASVTGPAVGGILYAWRGPITPYGVDCVMMLGALFSLSMVKLKPKVNPPSARIPVLESVTSGMRFVFGHSLLLAALAMDMFAVLFGGVEAILPIFAAEILNVGPIGLGILRAAPAAGALIGSACLIIFPITRHAGKVMLWVVAGFGFCMLGFAVSKVFWLSVLLLAASGGLDSVSMVIRVAIVQLCSPDEMRGRVAAVNSIFIGSSNEIGAFESGLAAKFMGTVPSVLFGGCITLLTVLVAALCAPELRRMNLDDL